MKKDSIKYKFYKLFSTCLFLLGSIGWNEYDTFPNGIRGWILDKSFKLAIKIGFETYEN